MKPLLMVLRPRAIPDCVASLEALPIDRVDLIGFTEAQLVEVIEWVVTAAAEYSHILLTSDDAIHPPAALELVLGMLADGVEVATAWSNLDSVDPRCNLARGPLLHPQPLGMHSYDLYTIDEARAMPDPVIRTWLAGYALTGMSREMWIRYPFQVYGADQQGWASDYHLCWRLQNDGVPIYAHRDAELYHVKEIANQLDQAPEKRLLVGEVAPKVRWTRHAGTGVV